MVQCYSHFNLVFGITVVKCGLAFQGLYRLFQQSVKALSLFWQPALSVIIRYTIKY